MTGNEVRSKFLEYFKARDHQVVRSSSLVPQDDPTLLFVNAGMVQFKRAFLGEENRGYLRAATSQKCVRAGGKHNDLENVGYTARHHTFFEMLGNFSFGDYFKEKAIEYGWELLTRGYGLPEDKLWVSIYLDDDEAHDIWHRQIGVPEAKILRFGEEDNFWAMGDTGPCGPCSEIHLDRGEAFGCGKPDCQVGCDCDRFLEIWNLVFMQFNRDASGQMTPLPKPSIDTGLGLERMVSVLQQVPSNFETDLILPIIRKAEQLAQKAFGQSEDVDVALKVIADHSRAAAFLIGDGIFPSNEGRGYVLRRIMRRAVRYGRNIGLAKPFLHETATVVMSVMQDAYPDLMASKAFITNVIKNEEMRFMETLDTGLKLLNETIADMKAAGRVEIPGDVIFKLYDTYGFPVDIVQDVGRDEGIQLDMDGFNAAMDVQRRQSRSKVAFSAVSQAYKSLSASGFTTEFVGRAHLSCEARIHLLVRDGEAVDSAAAGQDVELIVDRTPFYAEAGGQVGDQGRISGPSGGMTVTSTIKDPTGLTIHRGQVAAGELHNGDAVTLAVDEVKRAATQRNHTATHILHSVLRRVLGDHVKQAGSLVAPDRLRFDFSHFSQIDPETLEQIERLVNERIRDNISAQAEEMEAEDAFKSGATALFEEKYGDVVRVVSLSDFSKELCGGTHVAATGDIGVFKILSESSVAAGIRRIEALTGQAAVEHIQSQSRLLQESAQLIKDKPDAVPRRIQKLLADHKALEKEVEQLKAKLAVKGTETAFDETRTLDGIKVWVKQVALDTPAALRDLADQMKDRIRSGIVVLGSATPDKALFTVIVTKDLTDRYHAGQIVKELAAIVGGSGGGRPDMAQAGGSDPAKLEEALAGALNIVKSQHGQS